MGKNKISGAREARLYPKSSGASAMNENQVPTPFNWYLSSDKKTVYITPKEGYVVMGTALFSFTTSDEQGNVFQAVYEKSGFGEFSARGRYGSSNIGLVEVVDAATDYVELLTDAGVSIATFSSGSATAVGAAFKLWLFY